MLIGALAALRYRGSPRMTTDVDVLVATLDGVVAVLEGRGFEVVTVADGDDEPYLLHVRGNGMRADILRAETAYQRTAIARAEDGCLSVEDVLVHKLIAWRSRDRDDVRSILGTGIEVDEVYVSDWAQVWDVDDRWREAQQWRRPAS